MSFEGDVNDSRHLAKVCVEQAKTRFPEFSIDHIFDNVRIGDIMDVIGKWECCKMNVKEFVKDWGMEVAKRTLDNAIGFGCSEIDLFGGKYVFRTDDLKDLVGAYEFVRAHKSVEAARKYCDLHDPYGTSNHYNNLRAKIELVGEL